MKGFPLKGNWNKEYFNNDHPNVLELGCGKGEYTVGLAREFPEKNYIGMDIKGARIWTGSRRVADEGLTNVAFIRTRIELIEHFFAAGEINEIWLTFPDPQPKKINARKRLSSPLFLRRYSLIIKDNGLFHLKTDNSQLFEYTLEVIEENGQDLIYHTRDLYASGYKGPASQILTFYESKFKDEGEQIKYLQFKFKKIG